MKTYNGRERGGWGGEGDLWLIQVRPENLLLEHENSELYCRLGVWLQTQTECTWKTYSATEGEVNINMGQQMDVTQFVVLHLRTELRGTRLQSFDISMPFVLCAYLIVHPSPCALISFTYLHSQYWVNTESKYHRRLSDSQQSHPKDLTYIMYVCHTSDCNNFFFFFFFFFLEKGTTVSSKRDSSDCALRTAHCPQAQLTSNITHLRTLIRPASLYCQHTAKYICCFHFRHQWHQRSYHDSWSRRKHSQLRNVV